MIRAMMKRKLAKPGSILHRKVFLPALFGAIFILFSFQWQLFVSLAFLPFFYFSKRAAAYALASAGISLPFFLFSILSPDRALPCDIQFEGGKFEAKGFLFSPPAERPWRDRAGFQALPNKEWLCTRPGLPVMHYKTGGLGIRGDNLETPLTDKQRLVFTVGCSFTVGLVDEKFTLARQLENASGGSLRALNLGVGGGGLQNVMAVLRDSAHYYDRAKTSRPPIAIYTFLYDHPERFAQRWPWFMTRLSGKDFYMKKNHEGKFVDHGPGRIKKLLSFLQFKVGTEAYSFLVAQLFSLRRKNIHAYWSSDKFTADLDHYFDGITNAAEEFYRSYPGGVFVLNYWWLAEGAEVDPVIRARMKKLDRRIVIMAHPEPEKLPRIPGDGHPMPEAYTRMASYIYGELRKR